MPLKNLYFFIFSPFLCINITFFMWFSVTVCSWRPYQSSEVTKMIKKCQYVPKEQPFRPKSFSHFWVFFLTDSTSKFQHKMHALPQIFTKLGENSLWGPIYYFILLFWPPLKGSDQCFDPLLNCTFFIWSMACSCLYIRILAIASNYHTWHIKFDLLKVIYELKWSYKRQVPFFRNHIMWDILFHVMYYSNSQSHKIKAISWSLTILKVI